MVASTPGVVGLLEQLGVVAGPGAHRVEVAGVAVEALGELLVHDRALAERELGHVPGQADQHRAAGLGVDARDRHRVRAQAPPTGAGVAAEQEHVEAAVRGTGDLAAAEHGHDEVPLHADQVRAEEQGGGDAHAEEPVETHDGEPVVLLQGQRLAQPPGVHEEQHPADGGEHERDPEQTQQDRVGDQVEHRAVPHRADDQGEDTGGHEGQPGAQRDQADPAVAGEQLGGAGHQQGHHHQGHRPTETDARGAVVEVARHRGGTVEHAVANLIGEVNGSDQYHQSHPSHPGATRRRGSTAAVLPVVVDLGLAGEPVRAPDLGLAEAPHLLGGLRLEGRDPP